NALDSLVERGLVPARSAPAGLSDELLEEQLGRVIIGANSMHTYVVQSAVNRALALARAYPDRREPLQAAAYGMVAMTETLYSDSRNTFALMLGQAEALNIIGVAEAGLMIEPDSVPLRFLLGKAVAHFSTQ